jgi:hypothetical protein
MSKPAKRSPIDIEDRVGDLLDQALDDPERARAIIAAMSEEEIAVADLQMAGGGRWAGGHLETPHRSGDPALTVCDICGRLDGSRPFMVVYHPANREYLP